MAYNSWSAEIKDGSEGPGVYQWQLMQCEGYRMTELYFKENTDNVAREIQKKKSQKWFFDCIYNWIHFQSQ